jgi:cellulose synthase/poly-beta-1,6-N-acetylglucosamine synthase-like glycosyltransferase
MAVEKEQPMVSVIVPVRNGVGVIEDCLRAMTEQTYPSDRLEVIVVDDESTDNTREYVEEVARQWRAAGNRPVLKLVPQQWAGAGAARNRGVQESTGSVVVFTDADCEPLEYWVEAIMAPFEDPGVGAVAGGYLTRQKSIVARMAQAEFEERYRFLDKHATIDIAFTHSAAVRRDIFLESGGFDERMPNNADDLELSYRLAVNGCRIVYAADAQVYHRHPATLGDYISKKFGRGYWRTLVFKRYPKKLIKDSYTPGGLKLQILLVGLGIACLAAGVIGPSWLAAIGAIALIAALGMGLPFAARLKGSLSMRLFAPVFLIVQAAAIGLGVLSATFATIEQYGKGGKRL